MMDEGVSVVSLTLNVKEKNGRAFTLSVIIVICGMCMTMIVFGLCINVAQQPFPLHHIFVPIPDLSRS